MRKLSSLLFVLVACTSAAAPAPVLMPEAMRGNAAEQPSGRVMVIQATCGGIDAPCEQTWTTAIDNIVVSSVEFTGYDTLDPMSLKKDERTRVEDLSETNSRVETSSSDSSIGGEIIGIIPIARADSSSSKSLTISRTTSKTVHLEGAVFEDLAVEDRAAVMNLAGVQSVLTTRINVGANYSNWASAQVVDVVVKLSAADTGDMRWSTRCTASSTQFPSLTAALEAAAKCAMSTIPGAVACPAGGC